MRASTTSRNTTWFRDLSAWAPRRIEGVWYLEAGKAQLFSDEAAADVATTEVDRFQAHGGVCKIFLVSSGREFSEVFSMERAVETAVLFCVEEGP